MIKVNQDRKDFELILKAYNEHGYKKGARGIWIIVNKVDTKFLKKRQKVYFIEIHKLKS